MLFWRTQTLPYFVLEFPSVTLERNVVPLTRSLPHQFTSCPFSVSVQVIIPWSSTSPYIVARSLKLFPIVHQVPIVPFRPSSMPLQGLKVLRSPSRPPQLRSVYILLLLPLQFSVPSSAISPFPAGKSNFIWAPKKICRKLPRTRNCVMAETRIPNM